MTESSRTALLVFIASVLTVIGLLGFTTARMITLEREELRARTDASHQESLRLALWRLDSAIAPIIAQEAARPYFHYLSYYPEQRAFTRIWEPVLPGEVLVPSPLVEGTPRFVLLHFQLNALGVLTSPQVPRGNDRDLAESEPNGTARIQRFERILETFQTYYPPDLARFSDPRRTVPTGPIATEAPSLPPSEAGLGDEADLRTQATFSPGRGTSQTQAGQIRTRAPFPTQTDAQSQAEIEYTFRKEAAELAASPAPVVSPIPAMIGKADSTAAEPNLSKPGPPPAQQARTKSLPEDPADSQQRGAHGDGTAAPATTRALQRPVERAEGAIRINAGNPLPQASGGALPEAMGGFQTLELSAIPAMPANAPPAVSSRPDMNQTPFLPRWRVARPGDTPMLTFWRTVRTESSITAQGFWVDWPALERHLLSLVNDLLPEAAILPILTPTEGEPEMTANLLASIPAKLISPPPETPPIPFITPAHLTLALTWLATLGAIAAVGLSLRASIALGERRGRFVSAVTHELRTPLTTFCLYSQMLADNMVSDEQSRREYIETLRDESTRLQRIVENVLEFARLGRAHAPALPREPLELRPALQALLPALSHRAQQAGGRIELVIGPDAADLRARVSRDTIERILLNLVDNACKYGITPDTPTIALMLTKSGNRALIQVIDHGPGISARDRRSIFKPFARGRSHHTSPAQGLGLGLSLARALAKQAGGTLELLPATQAGATFQAAFLLA